MAVPYTLIIEVAFDTFPIVEADAGPPEVPAWVDVSEFVRDEITTSRGRSSEVDEIEAGTATFTLRNVDRRFDPDYAAGAYYPNIVPGRRVRISASVDAVVYRRFTGFVQSWVTEYPEGTESYVKVRCVDAFKYFSNVRITANLSQQLTSDRITSLMDASSPGTTLATLWPTTDRDIATGAVTVEADRVESESILAHIQMCARAEQGLFFIAGDGDATFQNRTHRDSPSSAGVYSNKVPPDADDLPYNKLIVAYDDSMIWNQIEVTRRGGIRQTAVDFDSMDNYNRRVYRLNNLVLVDDAASLAVAELMLVRYRQPITRPRRLVIDPAAINGAASEEDCYAEVLEREISDAITVKRTTLIDGDETVWESHIERIEDRISLQKWEVTFTLSPVFSGTPDAGTLNTTDDWIAPTLLNSWVNFGGGLAEAGYRKEADGWIALRGVVDGIGSTDVVIFNLPVGYRPDYDSEFVVFSRTDTTDNASINTLKVTATGDVTHVSGVSRVRLHEVRFRVI